MTEQKKQIVVKVCSGLVEKVLIDGVEQEFTEEELVATPSKQQCSSCGKEVTHLNEGTLCDECYAKIKKRFKVKLKWEKEIWLGEFEGYTDEEVRDLAAEKVNEDASLTEETNSEEYELTNVETGTIISMNVL